MNLFSLKNKTAIVTGACGLLGQQHCIALAEAGANVIVADIDQQKASALAAELIGNHLGLSVDVTSKVSLNQAKEIILKKYSQIDILVNNAAVNDMFENPELSGFYSRFENYPLDSWTKSLEVNVTGVFLASQVFGSVMAEAGKGSIINIASTYGVIGPDQSIYVEPGKEQQFFKSPAYPATKGAIVNFTKYLAAYWGKNGVRVNTLSPGGVENGQEDWFIKNYSQKTLLNRMAQPQDYKGALVYLASEASSYMTGGNLIVDGGWTAI
ncbi:MAG: SDR family oxidoreductase [Chitinophagales bacterium]